MGIEYQKKVSNWWLDYFGLAADRYDLHMAIRLAHCGLVWVGNQKLSK